MTFHPAGEGWRFRENTAYQWQVKAKNGGGELVGKSKKQTFTTDMLHPITAIRPTYGSTATRTSQAPSRKKTVPAPRLMTTIAAMIARKPWRDKER